MESVVSENNAFSQGQEHAAMAEKQVDSEGHSHVEENMVAPCDAMGTITDPVEEAGSSKPWHSYDTVFLNAKAGMGSVDKEKVQKVVYEMSKGSRFYENEQRREAILKQRIESFRLQASQVSASNLAEIKKAVDKQISELEASRDLTRTWMHVDLDAFYAAVETLEDSSLSSKPMAVGSMSMICTANYEARKFGVRAAMPGFIACKLCPGLVLIKPDFEKYAYYSEATRQVFRSYDEHFMARSMDEAYLDITELCQKHADAAEVAERLRKDVYEKTKLTCSAGVAPNRLLAKVCSDINKPNGQFVLQNKREDVMNFISLLPIRKVCGIGKVTERLLKEVLCINTCSDFIEKRYMISALFSSTSRDYFLSIGLGIGGSDKPQEEGRKSISNERTFTATGDEKVLVRILGDLAESLANDMAKEGLQGRTLTLKLKTSTFEVRTRAVSVLHYIWSKEEIESLAIKLLKAELPVSLRLIGVRISHFKEYDPSQKTLTSFIRASSKHLDADPSPDTSSTMRDDKCRDLNDNKGVRSKMQCTLQEFLKSSSTRCHSEIWSGIEQGTGLADTAFGSLGKEVLEANSDDILASDWLADEVIAPESATASTNTSAVARGIQQLNETNQSRQKRGESCWTEEERCSSCGVKISLAFSSLRQEHEDYHFAQKIQLQDSGYDKSNAQLEALKKSIGKRQTTEEFNRRRRKKFASSVKRNSIDSYFSKD